MLDLTPYKCDKIDNDNDEGIEVSLGNWDRDGTWIPLAYYFTKPTNDRTIRIRDYDVPYDTFTGVESFKISVCGDDYLRDGLQIRWLQQVFLYTGIKRDVVTLDNVSINLIVNETSISLLEDGFDQGNLRYFELIKLILLMIRSFRSTNWNKDIRNSGVSTVCPVGSDDHKIVFGLSCTTFGCEKTTTEASRIATTVPLNITQLLSLMPVPGNQSTTTQPEVEINITSATSMGKEEVMSTISHSPSPTGVSSASTSVRGSSTSSIQVVSTPTAPATSSIDSSLAEELESTISNVLSIVSILRNVHVFSLSSCFR